MIDEDQSRDRHSRRLAAILAADIEGYSRLMNADEGRTVSDLKAHQAVILPVIGGHGGRVIDTAGDGILAEFASSLSAVKCAVEIQKLMTQRNEKVVPERQMRFRIGINQSDVIYDDNRVYGDGVNVAARLEGIADPGGVCISDDAYRQVRGKLEIAWEDLGAQTLKNIAEPMRVWRAQFHGREARRLGSAVGQASALALPDKPSIAVLPFQNMSGDPEQEYFADGMVEDIITALSRFRSLFVIARNSSFTYKGKTVDIKQVGRELGVRYVLEGSVRKSGNRVRITGQLIEAATETHVWADRIDGPLDDVFDLQDKVARQVVGAIAPSIERAEIERTRQKPILSAYDWYLRGVELHNVPEREAQTRAIEMFRRATEADPTFASAYAAAIVPYIVRATYGWSYESWDFSEPARLARKSIELDQEDPAILARSGFALAAYAGEYQKGRGLLERAVRYNPNLAWAQVWLGLCRVWKGEYREALECFEISMRLDPLDPYGFLGPYGLAQSFFFLNEPGPCREYAELTVRAAPEASAVVQVDILSLVAVNSVDEAKSKFSQLTNINPKLATIEGFRRMSTFRWCRDIEKVIETFRIAGLTD